MTPLHLTAVYNNNNNYNVVELLLARGANPYKRDYNGMTPLQRAQQKADQLSSMGRATGSKSVVELLKNVMKCTQMYTQWN